MKRAAEFTKLSEKKMKMPSDGSFSESSPPSNHFALGALKFVVVAPFLDSFKIHIRQYASDDNGLCHPTKRGVVMSPYVWECFSSSMQTFTREHVLVVEKELCVSSNAKPNQHQLCPTGVPEVIQLQKMFQRFGGSFQFTPAVMVLTSPEFEALTQVRLRVSKCFREQFFGSFFRKMVLQAKNEMGEPVSSSLEEVDLFKRLVKLLKNDLDVQICELYRCNGDQHGYQWGHECMTHSASQRFSEHFERAFARLDIKNFCEAFVRENAKHAEQITEDFLESVSFESMHEAIRELFNDDFIF